MLQRENTDFEHQYILDLHRELDQRYRTEKRKAFVSGWQTAHPFSATYLPPHALRVTEERMLRYSFLSDDSELQEKIVAFHKGRGEGGYDPVQAFASAGSSPLILAQFLLLKARGMREAYFIPPIYYTYYYFAKNLGIRLKPATSHSLHQDGLHLQLPRTSTALFITDPIWIMGARVDAAYWKTIRCWQFETNSLVFVDGTFQYFGWEGNGSCPEASANLDRELTFRLVCPTKSLALHGARLAYLLLPKAFREDIRYACSNTIGATSAFESVCAHQLLEVLTSPSSNSALIEYVKERYATLRASGAFSDVASEPNSTYYVLVRLNPEIEEHCLCMHQRFFGLTEFDGFVRYNLLGPYSFSRPEGVHA